MKQLTSWQSVSRIKGCNDVILGHGIMMLYLCTETATISSRGSSNVLNFLFERQKCNSYTANKRAFAQKQKKPSLPVFLSSSMN